MGLPGLVNSHITMGNREITIFHGSINYFYGHFLWSFNITMERSTMLFMGKFTLHGKSPCIFHGKIHYFYGHVPVRYMGLPFRWGGLLPARLPAAGIRPLHHGRLGVVAAGRETRDEASGVAQQRRGMGGGWSSSCEDLGFFMGLEWDYSHSLMGFSGITLW